MYGMRRENLPNAPIYNQRLQTALREVKSQLGELESIIGRCPIASDDESKISALFKQVINQAQFEYPTTRTIGFVGDSGVGEDIV